MYGLFSWLRIFFKQGEILEYQMHYISKVFKHMINVIQSFSSYSHQCQAASTTRQQKHNNNLREADLN